MKKLPVGTKLYDYSYKEYEITAIGIKYYIVECHWKQYKVSIDTLKYQDKIYSHNNKQFYLTQQEIEDKKASEVLHKFISSEFRNSNCYTFTLEQLRQIKAIIS